MSNLNNRVKQIEKKLNPAPEVKKYMCVTSYVKEEDAPEKVGYSIQPYGPDYGGTGGEPFTLHTRAEFDEFSARPDVDITWVIVGYDENSEPPELPEGLNAQRVGIDLSRL